MQMPEDKQYAWQGKVIRLVRADLDQWKKSFSYLDVEAALLAKDIELAEEGSESDRKRWFVVTAMWLMAMNQTQRRLTKMQERKMADPYRGDPLATQYDKEEN
jgi:hypothetical protein